MEDLVQKWSPPPPSAGCHRVQYHAGGVGMDEAHKWSLTGVLESRGDEGIGVMLRPSTVELDTARDPGHGGVGGLPPGMLVLEDLELTTGNCILTHACLGWKVFSRALHRWRMYGWLSSLLTLVLALTVLGPLLDG